MSLLDLSGLYLHRWAKKRRDLLLASNTKLVGKLRKYELKTYDGDDVSPFKSMTFAEQNDFVFNLVKDACFDRYSKDFYPYYDVTEDKSKIKFKVGKNLHSEIRRDLTKLTSLLRPIIQARENLSSLYSNLTCGLVARTVFDIINDFLNIQFPEHVERLCIMAKGSLSQMVVFSHDLQADVLHLQKALSQMYKFELIGGQIVSFLDRQEYKELTRSFIPGLFQKCIATGMEHYNRFLHEFLYHGYVNSDRFYEFPIWDLSKTLTLRASDFRSVDERHDLAFDRKFVVIADLIPSVWKEPAVKSMMQTAMHTRRLISVLNSSKNNTFVLREIVWPVTITVNEEYSHVREANAMANEALLGKINETFNIQHFYDLLDQVLFNPSSMWVNDFVAIAEALMSENADPDKFIHHLKLYFSTFFEKQLRNINKCCPLMELELYSYALFDKVLPSDQRLVDFLNVDIEIPNDDLTLGVDENDPVSQFSISNTISEKCSNHFESTRESSPMNCSDGEESLRLIDQIGLKFHDDILVKCLIPPQVQEHLNRLFRLKLKLALLDYLATRKKLEVTENVSKTESLFAFGAHGFFRRYSTTVFGYIANEQWQSFMKAAKKLKGVDSITEAQQLLIRNIFSPAGLYSGSTDFASTLHLMLTEWDDYCRDINNELNLSNVMTSFYDNYKEMRQIVYNNEHFKLMSYSVFRIPSFTKLDTIESIEIDPRKGALGQTIKLQPTQKSSSHRRSINLMPKRA